MASNKDKKKKSSFLTTNKWLGETTPSEQEAPLKPDLSAEQTDSMPQPEPFGGKDTVTPPPSKIIARSELAELTAHMAFADEHDDEAIDLATPPGGATTGPPSLSKILKATGTKSDILRGVKGSDSGTNLTGPGS